VRALLGRHSGFRAGVPIEGVLFVFWPVLSGLVVADMFFDKCIWNGRDTLAALLRLNCAERHD
jgi:hypothetical protein